MSRMDEDIADLFEQYKDEVRDIIQSLDTNIVQIEQDPSNSEVIFSIFRHLHSLKGSSSMFNVDNMALIAHKLEDLMQSVDSDNSILRKHPNIVDLLFTGNDFFQEIITNLEDDIDYINLTPDHAKFIEEMTRQIAAIEGSSSGIVEKAQALLTELERILPEYEELNTNGLQKAADDLTACIRISTTTQDQSAGIRYSYDGIDLTDHLVAFESGLKGLKADGANPEIINGFFNEIESMVDALLNVADEQLMGLLQEINDGLGMYHERSLEMDPMIIEFFSQIYADLKSTLDAELVGSGDLHKKDFDGSPSELGFNNGKPLKVKVKSKTIRVNEKKIDMFLESVGKLIIQSESLNHLQHAFDAQGVSPDIIKEFSFVNRSISNDIIQLQQSIMEVRQVVMDNILKKFPRLVRDLSREMGKEVEFKISGQTVAIDKSLLEDVEQALIHLVRNAIDHGIEGPDQREAVGKNRRGLIKISVLQEETSILIEMSDDGRGIDYSAVQKKALDRGVITSEQLAKMSDRETERLVFFPGITTKTEATDISGRGVGLDVVMSNIKKWSGEVELVNKPGHGTKISLRLPITNTLLTNQAIMLKLIDQTFCLPLDSILEIVTIPAENIHRHKEQIIFEHRNRIISVVEIEKTLGLTLGRGKNGNSSTMVILKSEEESQKAIVADEILGQQKIVIKKFELAAFQNLELFQGFCLTGDGRAVLVLDAETLLH